MTTSPDRPRLAAWLDQWGDILPLLVAEFVVWLGFGGLLPVLPLYFTEHGLDLATLGLVIAAWPAARLVSEPIFGLLADRFPRKPFMVGGLLAGGILGALPLIATAPLAFLVLRAGAGLCAAIYDPAARGFLTDATPPGKRGEAFGLYGAAQMGGLLLGPAIAAFGAANFGGIGFVFVFSGVAAILAAIAVAARVRETPVRTHAGPAPDWTEFPPDPPSLAGRAARDLDADRERPAGGAGPTSLWSRGLIAALIINAGGYYAGGTYEVIWSLFLQHLGADLSFIGLTFAMFGLPVLLFSPIAGRIVDRRGSLAFIVIGSILPAITGIAYTLIGTPWLAIPLILIESTGFAFLNPALYAVVAANSPPGRSSTAQGWFGAAGTMGFIVASLGAGVLAERNLLLPFYVFTTVLLSSLVIGLIVGGRRLAGRAPGGLVPSIETPSAV
jgi:MFS transporter, DHA1 family, tetracycline resistance protein